MKTEIWIYALSDPVDFRPRFYGLTNDIESVKQQGTQFKVVPVEKLTKKEAESKLTEYKSLLVEELWT